MTIQTKKVLIIEDDEFLRELYFDLVNNQGYTVDSASDGLIGLEKAQKGGYDLILLDIMLPRLDGIGVLKKLHQNPPKVPNGAIVLLTNLGQESIMKEAMNLGAAAYLIKSELNPDQVVQKVKEFLKDTQQ